MEESKKIEEEYLTLLREYEDLLDDYATMLEKKIDMVNKYENFREFVYDGLKCLFWIHNVISFVLRTTIVSSNIWW